MAPLQITLSMITDAYHTDDKCDHKCVESVKVLLLSLPDIQ